MKSLYIDGQAGAAGDMILGALIDLGADLEAVSAALRPVVPSGFTLEVTRVSHNGIAATRLNVVVVENVKHRHLPQVLSLLANGRFSTTVKNRVEGVFRRLATAEAKVHSSTMEKVHFHEVGANDAMIDIIGSIWAIESLGVDQVFCAPLILGSGVGVSAHGPMNFPAPAVVEILKGIPVRHVDGLGETTTPTGAAILAEVAEFSSDVMISADRIGYGAGTKIFPDRPNLLRATIGEVSSTFEHDTLWLGTSDIDNTRPEVFEWVGQQLQRAGAVDVTLSLVGMKKGRQGTRIEVLCDDTHRRTVAETILQETGSLGVRWHKVERTKLSRRIESVATPWGEIHVKVAEIPTGVRAVPEYDDCREAASKHRVPLIEVIERTTRLYYDQHR